MPRMAMPVVCKAARVQAAFSSQAEPQPQVQPTRPQTNSRSTVSPKMATFVKARTYQNPPKPQTIKT
eukprot:248250-Amphidinium_carterae.1